MYAQILFVPDFARRFFSDVHKFMRRTWMITYRYKLSMVLSFFLSFPQNSSICDVERHLSATLILKKGTAPKHFCMETVPDLSISLQIPSMMEQTYSGKAHRHVIFIAGCNYMIITNGSARLCHIGNTTFMSALDIIPKWEKCI